MFAEYNMMLQGWTNHEPRSLGQADFVSGVLVLLVIVENVGLTKRKNYSLLIFTKDFVCNYV